MDCHLFAIDLPGRTRLLLLKVFGDQEGQMPEQATLDDMHLGSGSLLGGSLTRQPPPGNLEHSPSLGRTS